MSVGIQDLWFFAQEGKMAIGVDGVVGAAALRLVIKEDKQGFNSFDNFVIIKNVINIIRHHHHEHQQKRTRTCLYPDPGCKGSSCPGSSYDSRVCTVNRKSTSLLTMRTQPLTTLTKSAI